MNETETRQFQLLYQDFESGHRVEALRDLRDLARTIAEPWDKAELLYHEALFLLEMGEVRQSRLRLEDFEKALSLLIELQPDNYRSDRAISLTVMALYAEVKILFAEERDAQALQVLENLLSRYPKHLSLPLCREIFNDIEVYRGLILANLGRWKEAKYFLENSSPPKSWEAVFTFYLGRCYYELKDYARAKPKLMEALQLGLTGEWQARAHYVLGLVQYHLGDMKASKSEFEACLRSASAKYLSKIKIWEWLATTSQALGLDDEAARYRKRSRRPLPGSDVN
jgi:tetratricopeptide (TPR) repeat protein